MVPAMIVLGVGLGLAFVPITIAATSGVSAGDSGLASGLLNTTQQVGGALGLAIMSTVSSVRSADALRHGASVSAALTHGFQGAFAISAALCAIGLLAAVALLPRRARAAGGGRLALVAMSIARCPGAPFTGHLVRALAVSRRLHGAAKGVVTRPKESNPARS